MMGTDDTGPINTPLCKKDKICRFIKAREMTLNNTKTNFID